MSWPGGLDEVPHWIRLDDAMREAKVDLCNTWRLTPLTLIITLSLWTANTCGAQTSDPYRAELRPIRSVLSKNPDDASPSTSEFSAQAPERLKLPTINVSSNGARLQQDSGGEPLPGPKQDVGNSTGQVENEGIVRMLKPLVVGPQNRELLTQRYANGQVMIEREVALDQHGNYMNDGSWKMYDMDQQLMGSGRFQNGQMIGLWRRTHLEPNHPWLSSTEFRGFQSPFHSSAEFVDGKLEGVWLIKDNQDRKVVELNYKAGRRNGSGTWWHPNGEVRRKLSFQDDVLHGAWQEWNADKQLIHENWFVEGQRIDKQVNNFAADRPESEVSFLEAKLILAETDDWWNARLAAYQPSGERIQTGPVKAWYDNGQRHMAGYYKDGKRHGEFAWWHDNGHRKLIASYDQGQRIGKWIWWHENGIKAAEGSFKDDAAIGQWTAWNDVGEITSQRILGTDRETVARPDYDAETEALEALPPQLEQGNLSAPIAPSFEELELAPPQNNSENTESQSPTEPEVKKEGATTPETPATSNEPPAGSEAPAGNAAVGNVPAPSGADPANASDAAKPATPPTGESDAPKNNEAPAGSEQESPPTEAPPAENKPAETEDPPPRPAANGTESGNSDPANPTTEGAEELELEGSVSA
ncbi:MAG: hypothetical protein JNL67_17010 [Planctomycetaceae bacterium]|nr:hypothetical protein [Planctomycetaceae bacterium]